MPGFNGLQLAESLKTHPAPPAVVFVTAHSRHALAAFEVNAIDYLVKPVDPRRLEIALDKVTDMIADASADGTQDDMRIAVSKGNRKILLDASSIVYIMAKDDYSHIYTDETHYLFGSSLTAFEQRLGSHNFFRTHRRYLVNLHWVSEANPAPGGALTLVLRNNEHSEIPVSRRRVAALRDALHL
jgi:two-component system LytT family response regulator